MAEEVMTYRGICQHGKVRFMAVDEPDMAKENAHEVAKLIRAGFTIDRVTVEVARKSDMKCEACDAAWAKPKRKRQRESLQQAAEMFEDTHA